MKKEKQKADLPQVDPLLVDVPTALAMLSIHRTKLFELMKPGGSLQRVKIGRKTLVTMESVRAVASGQVST